MPVVAGGSSKIGSAQFQGRIKWARGLYDFAVDGGLVSAIALRGDQIPSGAYLLDSFFQVDTLVTGGGSATVSLGVESAADLRAAATLATAPALSTTGPKRSLVRMGTADPIVTTAVRSITATVAVAALTAGKFQVLVAYVELAATF